MAFMDVLINTFLPAFLARFREILFAPVQHPHMIWIIIPLLITVVLMELYFGRYPREDLGYHGALESTIYLFFIAFDLIRYIAVEHMTITKVKVVVICLIAAYAFLLSILDFFHKIPRNIAFKINSKSIIGFTAYIAIVVVYSDVLNDLSTISIITTLISIGILFFVYSFFISSLQTLEPKAHDEVDDMLMSVEEEIGKAAREAKSKESS